MARVHPYPVLFGFRSLDQQVLQRFALTFKFGDHLNRTLLLTNIPSKSKCTFFVSWNSSLFNSGATVLRNLRDVSATLGTGNLVEGNGSSHELELYMPYLTLATPLAARRVQMSCVHHLALSSTHGDGKERNEITSTTVLDKDRRSPVVSTDAHRMEKRGSLALTCLLIKRDDQCRPRARLIFDLEQPSRCGSACRHRERKTTRKNQELWIIFITEIHHK